MDLVPHPRGQPKRLFPKVFSKSSKKANEPDVSKPKLDFKAWESPAFRVAFVPHIVEGIIKAASPRTQAVCLRVNRLFHAMAGPIVYRTAVLNDDTLWSLLRGSLICEKWSKARMRDPPIAPTMQREQVVLDTLGWTTIGTNFKAPLLARVKILTLESHDFSLCIYAGKIAPLFPNVEILRFAPNIHPDHEHTLRQVCDGGLGTDMCELQTGLDPRKLVFRNIDADALRYSPGREWNGPALDSVVYFYPMDSRRYMHSPFVPIVSHFTDIKDFKIIFWPSWEPSKDDHGAKGPVVSISPDKIVMPLKQLVQERPRETCMDCMHDMMAALDEDDSDYEDNVNRIIRQATKCLCAPYHAPAVAIYGLESVFFEPAGEVFTTWRSVNPDVVVSQTSIAKMVEEEIRSSIVGRTYAANMMGREPQEPPPVNVTFSTIEEYLVNCVREAEVCAED